MNLQTRSTASWSLVLLVGAAWLLLHIDWPEAARWLRVFLVCYGSWMLDP